MLIAFLVVVEIIQLIIFFGLHSVFKGTQPFRDMYPEGPYTYSAYNTEFELELEYEDGLRLRRLFENLTLRMPTPCTLYPFITQRNTLNVYRANGEKHSITFKGKKEILGCLVGIVEYDGVEYIVDYWLYKYGVDFCDPYHDEFVKWRSEKMRAERAEKATDGTE